jgi:hypothetical protein
VLSEGFLGMVETLDRCLTYLRDHVSGNFHFFCAARGRYALLRIGGTLTDGVTATLPTSNACRETLKMLRSI